MFVPDDLFERMQAHRRSWSEVLRTAVEAELRRLERKRVLERLVTSGPEHRAGTAARSIREDRDARR